MTKISREEFEEAEALGLLAEVEQLSWEDVEEAYRLLVDGKVSK